MMIIEIDDIFIIDGMQSQRIMDRMAVASISRKCRLCMPLNILVQLFISEYSTNPE